MAAPLSPDLQPLWDDLQDKSAASLAAFAAKVQTSTALTAAQDADTQAMAAANTAHKALLESVAAFITQFTKDYPQP